MDWTLDSPLFYLHTERKLANCIIMSSFSLVLLLSVQGVILLISTHIEKASIGTALAAYTILF